MSQRSAPRAETDYERQLLARARQFLSQPGRQPLTADDLPGLTRRHGIDFASAVLFEQLRDSAEHGPLIRALDSLMRLPRSSLSREPGSRRAGSLTESPRVLLVPGGCHGESTDSRECLQRVRGEVERLGYLAQVIPTSSFGTLQDNARCVLAVLRAAASRPLRLVSLSKGSAEVKLALREAPEAFENVKAWINVSGLLYGSQWVSWLLDRTVSNAGARLWCWYYGYAFDALEQLRRGPGGTLDFHAPRPSHMKMIHVAGFPLRGDLTHRYTVRSHQRLAHLGPNDGMGIMLSDLLGAGGSVYPVWRADHFLRPGEREMSRFVGAVLRYLDGELHASPPVSPAREAER